ncbi:MAG: alanine racemase [Myxococcales bacterium]|nr:alanine racemase [Myxococcales bacterium]
MLPRSLHDLPTPAVVVEADRLEANLRAMAALCARHGVRLRPHVKTHKCVPLARRQIELGAVGLSAAKVSEARVFTDAGLDDVLVAYPLRGDKVAALRALDATVSTLVDDEAGVDALAAGWAGAARPLGVAVKVDVGLGRVGVPWDRPERVLALARRIEAAQSLRFWGLVTHAGQAYRAPDAEAVAAVGRHEGDAMAQVAQHLRGAGQRVPCVSVGSTPTARFAVARPGVDELRPGVYVFHDAQQVALGAATWADCALTVLTTVVSRGDDRRAICDAGSKTFSSDRGAHGTDRVPFGVLPDVPGLGLVGLSEEHGWLRAEAADAPQPGERLRIVPAHACAVVNLARHLWIVQGERVVDRWPVAASGQVC